MSLLSLVYLFAGLLLLVAGAELLVRGAAKLAAQLGIPPLIIGLTVVAFGSSAPEAAVSVHAALNGGGDIAVGNVIGSNIANLLLILGASALLAPLLVARQLIRLHIPLMIAASLLVYALAWDGRLSRLDGALLFSAIILYSLCSILRARRETRTAEPTRAPTQTGPFTWLRNLALIAAGLLLLMLGSNLVVHGAVTLARALGLSELVIGLSVVAIGTSLPEFATAILAALRGQRDIAVGSIVGSNLFNLLCVLGLASLLAPQGLSISPNALAFDFPVMLAVAIGCWPILFANRRIERWHGLLFLGYYLAYSAYLLLFATNRPFYKSLGDAMLWYALPLTAVLLIISSARAWQRGVHAAAARKHA